MEEVAKIDFFSKKLKVKSSDPELLKDLDENMKAPTESTSDSRSYDRDYKTCKSLIGNVRGHYHKKGKDTSTSFIGKILRVFAGCVVLGLIIYKFIA